ncbi:DEAD/DEAH box helicase [Sphingobacterium psychroaquaticum]|uniref:DEAD/DEAH box helicase n=1 Tax=Sphingobacterium psychroaquaticum TaxID=561061 RepID=UPI00106DCEC6|nr:DEAD/DEAH box helicase [Sphingobacterium psychroaquaticum]QBQ41810.1 DEAD/DEAH box helicase [Sphingobacterium psychroaquaticum]
MKFNEFGFIPTLEEGLDSMGFVEATPIQEQAIPVVLEKKDLIACAQTGTGKTASYLLPILNMIGENPKEHIYALILAPTRELALQIDQQIMGLSYFTGATSIAVYGGGDGMGYEQQRRALQEGANIVVATPGRLLAHMSGGKVDFSKLKCVVLDEADRMLDMGFHEDIMRIITALPQERQGLLFSATMPPKIRTLAKKILVDPSEVNIAISKPSAGIDQQAYLVYDEQKAALLKHILSNDTYSSIIIFSSKKDMVKKLAAELQRKKVSVEGFHSDLDQAQREAIMARFRAKQLRILIGTDVISRGIDIEGISLVVNYDVPPDPEDYVHRIGRTARAATTGTAITFINDKDQHRFARIEQLIESEVPKMPLPEGFEAGPVYDPKKSGKKKRNSFKKKKPNRKPTGENSGAHGVAATAAPVVASVVTGEAQANGGEVAKSTKPKRRFNRPKRPKNSEGTE